VASIGRSEGALNIHYYDTPRTLVPVVLPGSAHQE